MTITVNLETIQDESTGFQTGGVQQNLAGGGIEDNVGNDQDLAAVTLPTLVSSQITAFGSPSLGGAKSATGAITVGANTTSLGFTLAGGAALPVDGVGGNTASSGLFTTGGEEIFLFTRAGNDNVVVGRDASGDLAFVIVIAETTSGGFITGAEFWMLQYQTINHGAGGTGLAHDNLKDLADRLYVTSTAAQDLLFDQFDGVSGQNQWLGFAPTNTTTNAFILLSGLEPTGSGDFDLNGTAEADTVNTSNATNEDAIGSNSQSITVGSGIRFEIVTSLNTAADTKNINTTDYGTHLPLNSAGFKLVQTGGSPQNQIDLLVRVYTTADQEGPNFSPGIANDNTSGELATLGTVQVFRGTSTTPLVQSTGTTQTAGGVTIVAFSDGTVQINNLLQGDSVKVLSASGTTFNRVLVVNNTNEGASNDTVDIGRFTASTTETSQQTTEVGSFLNFADDGPTATLARSTATATHDETPGIDADANDTTAAAVVSLFAGVSNPSADLTAGYAQSAASVVTPTTSAGNDGGGTTSFALDVSAAGVDSGLDTTDGTSIFLFKEGSLVVGRIGGSTGEAAVAFSINSTTGVLSTAQYASLKHPTGGTSYDESVNVAVNALRAVVTRTDAEGDSATASVGIGDAAVFQDDGPFIGDPPDRTVAFTQNATTPAATFALTGVDGEKIDVVGIPVAFTILNGDTITSSVFTDTNGNEGVRGVDSSGGDTFYELTFNPAAGTDLGSYTLKVFQSPPLVLNELDFSSVKAGGPQETLTVENIKFNGGFISATGGLFATFQEAGPLATPPRLPQSDDVNPNNAGGIGIGNGNIDRLESLVIDVTGSSASIAGVEFVIEGVGGGIPRGDILWEAVDNGAVVASGTLTNVDLRSQAGPQTVRIEPGTVFDQIYVALDPADFDANDTARINKVSTLEVAPHPDILLTFRVNADDGDGDQFPATYEEFVVTIDGTGTGTITPGVLGV